MDIHAQAIGPQARGPSAREAGSRLFAAAAAAAVFLLLAAGVLTLSSGGRSELDLLLRRARGDRLGERLTPAEASYPLEALRDGRVVPVTLGDVRDRLVFLNFWGTFCPPCIEELPSLLAMARSRAGDGVVVLAVSYDESWEAIEGFFRRSTSDAIPSNFVVLRDPGAAAGRDLKSLFGTQKLPESYVLRDGVVLARFVSARDWIAPEIVGLFNVLLGK